MDGGIRVTVMVSQEQNRALRGLAEKHKVSVAWLVRHAIDDLLDRQSSLQLPLSLGRSA